MRAILMATAIAAALAGCASGYGAEGFGGGFSEMQMAQDTYRIQFRGNAFTGSGATSEMAMLRAAELTLQSGYTHFLVLDAADSVDKSYYTQPGTTYTTLTPRYGGGYSATSNTYGGYTTPINKPKSEIFIKMVGADGNGLDAQQVYDRLAPKYKKTG